MMGWRAWGRRWGEPYRFHMSERCASRSVEPSPVSRAEAERMGYRPCGVCGQSLVATWGNG